MVMMTWSTSSHQKFDIRETLSINFDYVSTKYSVVNTESTSPCCSLALYWLGTRPTRQVQQLEPRVVV